VCDALLWPLVCHTHERRGQQSSCFDPNSPNFSAHTHTRPPRAQRRNQYFCADGEHYAQVSLFTKRGVLNALPNECCNLGRVKGKKQQMKQTTARANISFSELDQLLKELSSARGKLSVLSGAKRHFVMGLRGKLF
jgi:hypothetical protein